MLQGLRGLGRWLGEKLNTASARLLGRDRAFRYGKAGLATLPSMALDSLQVSPGAARRLARTRVYLLPGTPWPGVGDNGASWIGPWAERLQALGVGRATGIPYGGKSALLAHVRLLLEPLFHLDERRIVRAITADLAAHPLARGERIALLGHSYGTRLSGPVAEKLAARGLPVATVIIMEDRVPTPIGQFVTRAPAVRRVLEIENAPGKALLTAPGTTYSRMVVPELAHMDFVLSPPAKVLDRIVGELAR